MHRAVRFILALAPFWAGCASIDRPVTEDTTNVASPRAPEAAWTPLEPILGRSAPQPEAPSAGPGSPDMPGMDISDEPVAKAREPQMTKPETAVVYTCPMHSKIQEPKPGKCPICGMTLKPLPAATEGGHR